MKANEVLKEAIRVMEERGKERDNPNGERSIPRMVDTFNTLTGHNLTYRDGAIFMMCVKLARMYANDTGKPDDYVDLAAYCGLAAEHSKRTTITQLDDLLTVVLGNGCDSDERFIITGNEITYLGKDNKFNGIVTFCEEYIKNTSLLKDRIYSFKEFE